MLSPRDLGGYSSILEMGFTSRFEEVAELLNVWWLEINGKLDAGMLSPSTLYASYFVYKLACDNYGLSYAPTEFEVGFVGCESSKRMTYFHPESLLTEDGRMAYYALHLELYSEDLLESSSSAPVECVAAKERVDGWLEIELGEFFREESEFGELEMHVNETTGGAVKSGLIVGGIEIRPKHK